MRTEILTNSDYPLIQIRSASMRKYSTKRELSYLNPSICRETEFDNQIRVNVSLSQKRVPRTSGRKSRKPSGSPSVSLQLYAASPIVEIWSGAEDAGDASWVGEPAAVVPRDLHGRGVREVLLCRRNGGHIQRR